MNIKKVDDKPMVIHTKEKTKIHVKAQPETKIKRKYEDSINQIFCFEIFEKEDEDVLVIHLGYLKHNTKMALPSVLVFKNVPDIISYEISSKHTSEKTCGVLKMS